MTVEKIREDMIVAMKDKNTVKKDVLSALLSTTKNMAIDQGCKDDIPESLVEMAVLKEIKTVKEQIETCPTDRTELLEKYKNNLAILEQYAPKMMSEDEITAFLNEKFTDVISTKNKGQIMKAVMPELKGRADGKLINEIVTKLCS